MRLLQRSVECSSLHQNPLLRSKIILPRPKAVGCATLHPSYDFLFFAFFLVAFFPIPVFAQCASARNLSAQELKGSLKELKQIVLQNGSNNVYFAGINNNGQIYDGYVNYGGTGSHNLFLITIQDDNSNWEIVPIGNNEDEAIDNAPFNGELIYKRVAFFNGFLEKKPETFLFISYLNGSPYDNKNGSTATIIVDTLDATNDFPPYEFRTKCKFTTTSRFFDADTPLSKYFGITFDK